MGQLFKRFKTEQTKINNKYFDIINLSYKLQKALNITEEQMEQLHESQGVINCGEYSIVATTRCFDEWVDILEITPSNNTNVGYKNTQNPYWMKEEDIRGTRATNLPPREVIEEVLQYIKENN